MEGVEGPWKEGTMEWDSLESPGGGGTKEKSLVRTKTEARSEEIGLGAVATMGGTWEGQTIGK